MEILELYAELLLARAGLLDLRDKEAKTAAAGGEEIGIDPGLEEAAAAMIYAAPRLPREIRELPTVRNLLVERWGKDFAARVNENKDGIVPEKVIKKLRVEPPGERLVELYLTEIARFYGVDWPKQVEVDGVEELQEEVNQDEEQQDDQPDANDDNHHHHPTTPNPKKTKPIDIGRPFEREELSRATPPRDFDAPGTKSPVSIAPPAPSTDNPHPSLKIPKDSQSTKPPSTAKTQPPQPPPATKPAPTAATTTLTNQQQQKKNVVGGKIPDVDELAKRFQALKR